MQCSIPPRSCPNSTDFNPAAFRTRLLTTQSILRHAPFEPDHTQRATLAAFPRPDTLQLLQWGKIEPWPIASCRPASDSVQPQLM